jgi:Asp-tRNA(Asn)/Glu-tRNA(Gln) amidotransferase A subunit family amidase
MSEGTDSFWRLGKRNKILLASVLGTVLFLSTLTPVLNIPILPSSLLPAALAQQQGKETEDVPEASELAAMTADSKMTKEEGNDDKKFEVVEATIEDIHDAIKTNQITCTDLVQQYIDRTKAYNGVCTQLVTEDGAPIPPATGRVMAGEPIQFPTETVAASEIFPNFDEYVGLPVEFGRMEETISDPTVQAQFGQIVGIPDAGQINALATINIRGERSVTCKGEFDAHPSTGPLPEGAPEECEEFRQQPDALERAAELDAQYGSNPPLDEMPMYCIPFSIKDPWDTKDMRTTAGADVNYAMDAAPQDSTIVAELREKGAIIYAKASLAEYHGGPGDPGGNATETSRIFGVDNTSTWAGNTCNPYDTTFDPEGSSSGSPASVSANLAVCAICEQTGGSCEDPASRTAVVDLLTTKALISFGGASGSNPYVDRAGINCRTVKDTALVLDALKDSERGYFDPRDIYTALPNALIPEEPYATFIVDEKDKDSKPLAGMRIGIVREYMIKPTLNDIAMSDHINQEIKSVLRDKLGAELVESFEPLYEDDPDIPNMEYTFQDAIAEILPPHMPEYFFKTTSSGELEFAVPGHNVTSYDYMLKLTQGLAPLSDDLNMRRIIGGFPNALTFKFQMEQYLLQRDDERVKDWESLFANAKWYSDAQRAGAENWLSVDELRSEGKSERIQMRDVLRLVLAKVMHENDIDVLVNPENSLPPAKLGGPSEPTVNGRGMSGFSPSPLLGTPSIVVPAGFTQIVYEPQHVLSEDKTDYDAVTGSEQTLLDAPGLPIGIMFWAGPGDEPVLLKVASAYEAATHHRIPPPDFGPLSTFPVEHMSNSTASAGYGVYSQKPARAEYITNSSELVGDEIDSITLNMKRVGTINGTAEIGILNEDLSMKKLFGTLDVTTLTPTYTDYEFALTGDELYTIEAGDRIGIKYTGGSLESTSWISVMLDLEPEDPFDGANSYLQYYYQGTWRNSPDRDLYVTLVQTHG